MMKNEDAIKHIFKFYKKHNLAGWDGDGQEFFESVPEEDIIDFFKKLYVITPEEIS